jgi:plasmid stabilization system protein ParE
MKVLLSARVEAELAQHFEYGIERFGRLVAERTFARVHQFLFHALADYPLLGLRCPRPGLYERVIPKTPFVCFYQVDAAQNTLTVVAIFHQAQDRDGFGE